MRVDTVVSLLRAFTTCPVCGDESVAPDGLVMTENVFRRACSCGWEVELIVKEKFPFLKEDADSADEQESTASNTEDIVLTNPYARSQRNKDDSLLSSVAEMLQSSNEWVGSPTELVKALSLEMQPNKFTMRLNALSDRLATDYGIGYEAKRTRAGRRITLFRI